MPVKRLHIICFDIPFPPSYGGVIPVFYRIKALNKLGVRVILHCFYKGVKGETEPLEALCEKVYYYPRKTSFLQQLSFRPYGVASRDSDELLHDLLQDDAPIFFEGLVSCALMSHPALRNRAKYFRECNVEHDYYHALGRATKSLWKKLYLHIEAERLRWFERTVRNASAIFTLAHQDEAYFKKTYPRVPNIYFPCFHGHTAILPSIGEPQPYILYHGNLSVAENHKAAMYIVRQIAPKIPYPVVIAGLHPSDELRRAVQGAPKITLVDSPDEETMQRLIRNARIHLLITFQGTGIKLKLLNVLFTEGHVIVNPPMTEGTELADLCHTGSDEEQLVQLCTSLFEQPMDHQALNRRLEQLNASYSDERSARIIYQTIFEQ